MLRSAVFLAVLLTLQSGCSQQIAAYRPDPQSANVLGGGSARLKLVLKPAAFSDDGSFMCRLIGRISLPDGQSFGQYVMEALQQDLKASELTDQATGRELTLHLKRVDFSSALGATNWFLDVEYGFMDERFVVSTVYNDRSSYVGAKACGNIALYFRNAVAEHLRQLYSHPTFRRAAGNPLLGVEPRLATQATLQPGSCNWINCIRMVWLQRRSMMFGGKKSLMEFEARRINSVVGSHLVSQEYLIARPGLISFARAYRGE